MAYSQSTSRFFGVLLLVFGICSAYQSHAQLPNSVYVPLDSPCKVGDTRSTTPSTIAPNGFVEWLAYGDDLSSQGGAAAPGCAQPKPGMKPIAISVTINAIGALATQNGNLQVYPANGSAGGVTVVYIQGQNTANTTIVGLCNDGICDGKFKIESRQGDLPVSAIVTGYYYAQLPRVAHIGATASGGFGGAEGGDYQNVAAAMADIGKWCGTPSYSERCTIEFGPGVHLVSPISMQDYVSIRGAGVGHTILAGWTEGAVVSAVDVMGATLSDLSIANLGDIASANDPVGLEVSSSTEGSDLRVRDVLVTAQGGQTSTVGIRSVDSGGVDTAFYPVFEDVKVQVINGTGQVGMFLDSNWTDLTRVSAVAPAGTGLLFGGSVNLRLPIGYSVFGGDTYDVDLSAATAATFLHGTFVNGTFNVGSASATCLFSTSLSAELTTTCN